MGLCSAHWPGPRCDLCWVDLLPAEDEGASPVHCSISCLTRGAWGKWARRDGADVLGSTAVTLGTETVGAFDETPENPTALTPAERKSSSRCCWESFLSSLVHRGKGAVRPGRGSLRAASGHPAGSWRVAHRTGPHHCCPCARLIRKVCVMFWSASSDSEPQNG